MLTRSRSSSSVTSSAPCCGLNPSIRTIRFVVCDSSHTTGRPIHATTSSTGETVSAMPSARCRAMRLGTSSPSTSDRYDTNAVTDTNATDAATLAGRPHASSVVAQRLRQGGPAVRRREEPGERDPDLHGGQEAAGVEPQPPHPLAPAAGQPLDLALPQREHGQLGSGEEAADRHEHHDEGEAGESAGHAGQHSRSGATPPTDLTGTGGRSL